MRFRLLRRERIIVAAIAAGSMAAAASSAAIVLSAQPSISFLTAKNSSGVPSDGPVTSSLRQNTEPAESTLDETLSQTVLSGALLVSPGSAVLPLTRNSATTASAPLPLIRVTDARGTLTGWVVNLRPETPLPPNAELCVSPQPPTRVAGFASDIVNATSSSCAPAGGEAEVFFAPSGGGGGTYADSGTVTLRVPSAEKALLDPSITVAIDVS